MLSTKLLFTRPGSWNAPLFRLSLVTQQLKIQTSILFSISSPIVPHHILGLLDKIRVFAWNDRVSDCPMWRHPHSLIVCYVTLAAVQFFPSMLHIFIMTLMLVVELQTFGSRIDYFAAATSHLVSGALFSNFWFTLFQVYKACDELSSVSSVFNSPFPSPIAAEPPTPLDRSSGLDCLRKLEVYDK